MLLQRGERKIQIASSEQNPYSKGTVRVDTRVKLGDRYSYRETDANGKLVKHERTELTGYVQR